MSKTYKVKLLKGRTVEQVVQQFIQENHFPVEVVLHPENDITLSDVNIIKNKGVLKNEVWIR